ncbi:glycoside hydrolase family 25 protein [Dyadobacter tibetensis]|uniref:glycoside hydrolase family 25 protein n=1 Tax=Dyadobacter tibetensis TaxID=1211851 RepID=UPI00046F7232|nr:GH25 family lysozyme [Dyadobacter tibetensis]
MAKKKSNKNNSNSNDYLRPLPAKGWVILGAVCLIIGGLYWYLDARTGNRWVFIPQIGIKLPLRYAIHGIDVSHHNARIDWVKLKNGRTGEVGIDFAYIKATEGATHIDKQFERNWKEARRVGIKRGAYHFYNPRVLSDLQFENFRRKVQMQSGDLPPVLDLEVSAGKPDDIIIRGVRNWLTRVEQHYGVRPIIYVNVHFYKKYIAGNFDDYPLWLAGYSRTHVEDLASDAHVLFWQHSEKGWAPGIRGFVDYNVFLHSISEWEDL